MNSAGEKKNTRKRMCMPVGCLDNISAAFYEATSNSDHNTLLIIHAGTNDVMDTRSEELLEKYRQMIQRYKPKSNKTILRGILPQSSATTRSSTLISV